MQSSGFERMILQFQLKTKKLKPRAFLTDSTSEGKEAVVSIAGNVGLKLGPGTRFERRVCGREDSEHSDDIIMIESSTNLSAAGPTVPDDFSNSIDEYKLYLMRIDPGPLSGKA